MTSPMYRRNSSDQAALEGGVRLAISGSFVVTSREFTKCAFGGEPLSCFQTRCRESLLLVFDRVPTIQLSVFSFGDNTGETAFSSKYEMKVVEVKESGEVNEIERKFLDWRSLQKLTPVGAVNYLAMRQLVAWQMPGREDDSHFVVSAAVLELSKRLPLTDMPKISTHSMDRLESMTPLQQSLEGALRVKVGRLVYIPKVGESPSSFSMRVTSLLTFQRRRKLELNVLKVADAGKHAFNALYGQRNWVIDMTGSSAPEKGKKTIFTWAGLCQFKEAQLLNYIAMRQLMRWVTPGRVEFLVADSVVQSIRMLESLFEKA